MGVALAAAAAAQAVGSIMQGRAAKASADANAKIQDQNSKIATQNAVYAGQQGEAQAGVQGMKSKAQMAAIVTGQGASGVDVSSGSAANVRASQAELGQLDVQTIRSEAAKRAYGFQTESVQHQNQASVDRAGGKNAQTMGYINAATGLAKSAASYGMSGGGGSDLPVQSGDTLPSSTGGGFFNNNADSSLQWSSYYKDNAGLGIAGGAR